MAESNENKGMQPEVQSEGVENDKSNQQQSTGSGGGGTEEASGSVIRTGVCKWYNVTKGWGFISPDDDGEAEVFVHQTVIQMAGFRSLAKGEAVQFEAKPSDKGLEATMVMGLSDKELQGSTYRPKKRFRKLRRCYNCGQFASHLASECELGPLPKRCHNCKSEAHLVADCPENPKAQGSKSGEVTTTPPSQ